jgi:hypothetical protein
MAKEKQVEERNDDPGRMVTIQTYLSGTNHGENIKKMMNSLFKGQNRTMAEWKAADENINKRRVK